MTFLFMNQIEDPEADTFAARGGKVYESGTKPVDRGSAPPAGKPGSVTLTGGGPCVCGRCLFEWACPGVSL
jgi:hypothetical protein